MEATAVLTNTQTVQRCFSLFQDGNIPELLNELTDDIKWSTPGPREIPWAGDREGKKAVGDFFNKVNQNLEFLRFEPREFIEQGNKVVALGNWEAKVKSTGKTAKGDWAMAFWLKDGKAWRFQEYSDTYEIVQALKK